MPASSRFLLLPQRLALAACIAMMVCASSVRGEIYKFVDENGHVTYTNMPRPGARKLQLSPIAGMAATTEAKSEKKRNAAAGPTPAGFPRIDPGTQRKRDDMRRQLLVEELTSEQHNLTAAQSAYIEGRRQPGADLNRLLDAVHLHEKNIEMLNKELGHLR